MIARAFVVALIGLLAVSSVACVPPPTDPAPLPTVDQR